MVPTPPPPCIRLHPRPGVLGFGVLYNRVVVPSCGGLESYTSGTRTLVESYSRRDFGVFGGDFEVIFVKYSKKPSKFFLGALRAPRK